MEYLYLFLAIVFEIVATFLLKVSDGFSKIWAAALSMLAYVACFYFLSVSMRTLPMGVIYAIWSGLGIVAICLIGFFVFGQRIGAIGAAGIALIIAGVVLLNLFGSPRV